MKDQVASSQPSTTVQNGTPDVPMERIRSLLLGSERVQLDEYIANTDATITALHTEIAELSAKLARIESVQATKVDETDLIDRLEREIRGLTATAVERERQGMAEAIGPVIGQAARVQIEQNRGELAAALGDIVAEATRHQIRTSPAEMSDALAPVLLSAINQSIRDALRDFQRQVDQQIRRTAVTPIQRLLGRTPSAESTMRNALPFAIKQVFLIHNQTGLLIEHYSTNTTVDSDLVSAMLTAIRDFVGDAFQSEREDASLEEVQYGDEQIIIKNGEAAYVAVVLEGSEPAGFRTKVQELVSGLHVQFHHELVTYDGDPEPMKDAQPILAEFAYDITHPDESITIESSHDKQSGGGFMKGCLALLLFTVIVVGGFFALRSIVTRAEQGDSSAAVVVDADQGGDSDGQASEIEPTSAEPTAAPTRAATRAPTIAPTEPLATETPAVTSQPTILLLPAPANGEPPIVLIEGGIWAQQGPNETAGPAFPIPPESELAVLAAFGEWLLIELPTDTDTLEGWVNNEFATLINAIPANIVTPQP